MTWTPRKQKIIGYRAKQNRLDAANSRFEYLGSLTLRKIMFVSSPRRCVVQLLIGWSQHMALEHFGQSFADDVGIPTTGYRDRRETTGTLRLPASASREIYDQDDARDNQHPSLFYRLEFKETSYAAN